MQTFNLSSPPNHHLTQHITEILHLAGDISRRPRPSPSSHFAVFPVFIAGYASVTTAHTTCSLALLRALESDGVGKSTRTLRCVLEEVQQRREGSSEVNEGWDVDWVEVMKERGVQVVRFGL